MAKRKPKPAAKKVAKKAAKKAAKKSSSKKAKGPTARAQELLSPGKPTAAMRARWKREDQERQADELAVDALKKTPAFQAAKSAALAKIREADGAAAAAAKKAAGS